MPPTKRILGAVAVVGAVLTAAPAIGGPATTTDAVLPADSCSGTSAVWTGIAALVFGGSCGNHVSRLDAGTQQLVATGARFPFALKATTAVWTGTAAYIFGGRPGGAGAAPCECSDVIYRYDPGSDELTKMAASLPRGVQGGAAVWDGRHAYLFGGRYWDGQWRDTNAIVRYDPATEAVSAVGNLGATPITPHSAVWTGTEAYVFVYGGAAHVLRFDPHAGSTTPMLARFPSPVMDAAAAFDGRHAYVFGPAEQIHRYDPVTDTLALVGTMPVPRSQPAAVWTGAEIFVFGGSGGQGTRHVVRFRPGGPTMPRELRATSGPEVGTIHLRWQAPAETQHGQTAGYRIYRERTTTASYGTSGRYELLAQTGPETSYRDERLPWNTRYVYRVTAVDEAGEEGGLSHAAQAVSPAQPPSPVGLRKWAGAEAGVSELLCMTSDLHSRGCITFRGRGSISIAQNSLPFEDPDGTERTWPARTGRRFFAATTGATGGNGFLQGWFAGFTTAGGRDDDPFTGGTVAFAIRFDALPVQPVVIFRHSDTVAHEALEASLMPDGRVIVRPAVGEAGVSTTHLAPNAWHSVSLSYAPARPTLVLRLNGSVASETPLPAGVPSGEVQVGIVAPIQTAFALGIDDYVEASALDAPIAGARVGSLLPQSNAGPNEWGKEYHPENPNEPVIFCDDHMENWQMVSADVEGRFFYARTGGTHRCEEYGGSIGLVRTERRGAIDRYRTEGVPSRHTTVYPWFRSPVLPAVHDTILAVRLRAEAGPGRAQVGFIDGGVLIEEPIWGSEKYSIWGQQHPWRPSGGGAWDAGSLSELVLQLRSDPLEGRHEDVYNVQLDVVWVPE